MAARVISYIRFSTPRQRMGDSYRRQIEAAHRWCDAHGHKLDMEFVLEDLGISGFSGANAKKGALGELHRMCLAGELEHGTILIIEALDRLTRLPLPAAFALLLDLINAGLTIVTLTDDKVWSKASLSRMEEFLLSLSTLYRGFQESDQKSKRVREAFRTQRAQESNQAFGSAPGWLSREHKAGPWVVDESKAISVRRVFELSASGLGSKAIAAVANQESWPVPTRLARTGTRWHAQMPGQLLRNRAVLGEHEYRIRTHEANDQHWRGQATGQVVPDFYPRIVSDELWYRSRASIATRSVARRRDTHGYNIWSGLLFCGHCGAPLHRKGESRGQSRASIACSDRLAGITQCPSFSAANVDAVLLNRVLSQSPAAFGTPRADQVLTDIAALEAQESQLTEQTVRIEEFVIKVGGNSDSLAVRYLAAKDALSQVQAKLTSLREKQVLTASDYVLDEAFLAQALTHLYSDSPESRVVRAELHLKLARLIEHVWVWGYDLAIVEWKGVDWRTVIPLRHKVLPSRVNPQAKYHRPKPPRVVPEGGPYYALAAQDFEFEPPRPQRRNQVAQPSSAPESYLLDTELESPSTLLH
jgi:DNA invertase Pin-like site-specific DNA recombinase